MSIGFTPERTQAKQELRKVKPWVIKFARFGYAAKGTVYGIVGILSFMAALGVGGKTTGASGALSSIAQEPFGEILLWIVAIGLLGYMMWRFIQATIDPDNKGNDIKGIIKRVSFVVTGIIHGVLAYKAFSLVTQTGGSSGNSKQTLTAKLLSEPWGQWLIGIIGVIIIGVGIRQLMRAYKAEFTKRFKTAEMHEKELKWGKRAGRYGLSARGITFGIIGWFFIQSALTADPNKTKGLDAALSKIAQQPFGQILLGLVALGFIAYGIFMFVQARYRRIAVT